MGTIERLLKGTIFCLMLVFILLVSTTYTIDIRFQSATVGWLSACRVLLLFAAAAYLFTVRDRLRATIDGVTIVLVTIIAAGAGAGLLGAASWSDYFHGAFQYAFMLAFYLIGRDTPRSGIDRRQLRAASIAALSGYAIAAVLYALTPGLHSGAYSFQPNLALLPLAGGWGTPVSAAAGMLILIGNKRAVFLGAAFIIAALSVREFERRRGTFGDAVRIAATLALAPAIAAAATIALLSAQLPLVSTVSARFSTAPSFVNTVNTDAKVLAAGPTEASPASGTGTLTQVTGRVANPSPLSPTTPNVAAEARIDPMVRLTGARNVEVTAVWREISATSTRLLFGAGLGAGFDVDYISPNDYQPVHFRRDQADLMPAHIALTSGAPLAIAFSVALFAIFSRVFLQLGKLDRIDRTLALFALGLSLDVLLGFAATNPIIWSAIGYVSTLAVRPARAQR